VRIHQADRVSRFRRDHPPGAGVPPLRLEPIRPKPAFAARCGRRKRAASRRDRRGPPAYRDRATRSRRTAYATARLRAKPAAPVLPPGAADKAPERRAAAQANPEGPGCVPKAAHLPATNRVDQLAPAAAAIRPPRLRPKPAPPAR